MKIAICGASGSGKTTVAKDLAEKFKIPFISTSMYDTFLDEDKEEMQEWFGLEWKEDHQYIVKNSHMNPDFGRWFQDTGLKRRFDIYKETNNFITDRSPLDNMAYFQIQSAPYWQEKVAQMYANKVDETIKQLQYLIYVPPLKVVEDDRKRISNWYYQQAMDAVIKRNFDLSKHKSKFRSWTLFIEVLSTDRVERIETIYKYINKDWNL